MSGVMAISNPGHRIHMQELRAMSRLLTGQSARSKPPSNGRVTAAQYRDYRWDVATNRSLSSK